MFRLQCTVLVRVINFLTICLYDGYFNTSNSQAILAEKLFHIISLCILKPSDAGFNITDRDVLENHESDVETKKLNQSNMLNVIFFFELFNRRR